MRLLSSTGILKLIAFRSRPRLLCLVTAAKSRLFFATLGLWFPIVPLTLSSLNNGQANIIIIVLARCVVRTAQSDVPT
ncbi:MAG TPA: hypothetical protein VGK36_17840 [Candidatus Angelobacter sp.]|jgi:hypothetical protein